MSRDVNELIPEMKDKAVNAINLMRKDSELNWLGLEDVYISETKRTLAVQMAYYSRGRMSVGDTQSMYKAAGLYEISAEEAKRINTWTLKSKHIEGKAIDIVPIIDGKVRWSCPNGFDVKKFNRILDRMGEIGKEAGLKWGGDWKERDWPHYEID